MSQLAKVFNVPLKLLLDPDFAELYKEAIENTTTLDSGMFHKLRESQERIADLRREELEKQLKRESEELEIIITQVEEAFFFGPLQLTFPP